MWFGECRPGSERQVKLLGIQLTFGFYSDWTQLVFIDPERERERLWVQPWHCTSLAHPFIGCKRHDICTLCHHIKMDDHLHSYSHTNPSDQNPVKLTLPMSLEDHAILKQTHTHICFTVSFYTELLIVSYFSLFIKPFSLWNKCFFVE